MKLISRMSEEHFMNAKEQTTFVVNNLDFIVSQFTNFSLKKSDLSKLDANLEEHVAKLIQIYLGLNFGDLCNLSGQFIGDEEQTILSPEKVKDIIPGDLEKIGKEFLKGYKSKTE